MRMIFVSLCLPALLLVGVSLVGCDDKDNGCTGCSLNVDACSNVCCEQDHADQDGHQHAVKGPHGGQLIVLGEKAYQAELVRDENINTIIVYLLDATGKKDVSIEEKEITLQVLRDGKFDKYTLKASGRKDTVSKFRIVDEKLTKALAHGEESQGRLQVTIDGKPYSGTIEPCIGEHCDHDHEHEGEYKH
ncbi:MAG: hypothetical protein JXM70_24315 [Pirellulales bacterium]|nr:hypothetical protein [Pirellulales bacterium]